MPFVKGQQKVPGSGIKKGQSRRLLGKQVWEICEEEGVNPVRELCRIIQETERDDLKLKAASELCSYVFAKLKAVQHSGHVSTEQQIPPETASMIIEMAKAIKEPDDAKPSS